MLAEKWSKEDILLTYLMVSLFIVYVIHIYVNLYRVHTYIHC